MVLYKGLSCLRGWPRSKFGILDPTTLRRMSVERRALSFHNRRPYTAILYLLLGLSPASTSPGSALGPRILRAYTTKGYLHAERY